MSVNDPKRTSGAFDVVAYDGLKLLRFEPRRRPESLGVARAKPRSPLVIEPKSGIFIRFKRGTSISPRLATMR